MHGGPDAKQHSDNTCAEDIIGTAGVATGLPVHDVSAIAEQDRGHLVFCNARDIWG